MSRPQAAAVLAALSFILVGWTALLVPSLIRSIRDGYSQDDAGIGFFYLIFATAWAAGSYGGGVLVERLGRRAVLGGGSAMIAVGLIGQGLAPSWDWFVIAGVPAGIGAGVLDGGGNGLVLDLYTTGRGQALNLLHFFFSVGALAAPAAIGLLVERGASAHVILTLSGVVAVPFLVAYGVVAMPSGHRSRPGHGAHAASGPERRRLRLSVPLILLAVAISCYLASQVGVSSWLVRFLEPAPLATATFALALYWAGIAAGRLVSSQLADRFEHRRFTVACSIGLGIVVLAAIVAPSVPLGVALFGLAGLVSGPIFPMIVAIGGTGNGDRAAAVSGFLNGSAVVGTIVYPPIMGLLSVTVGLFIAMLGNVLLAWACGIAIVASRRERA